MGCGQIDRQLTSDQLADVKARMSTLTRKIRLSAARKILQRDKEQKAAARRRLAAKKKAEKARLNAANDRNQLADLRHDANVLRNRLKVQKGF